MMKGGVTRAVAVLMFLVFVTTFRVKAQQSQSNPAAQGSDERAGGSPPNPTATPAASKVVLKVGGQSVTQAEIESFVHSLDQQSQKALAQQGLRNLGEQYALMLALAHEATNKHLDESADFRRQMESQRERMLAQAEFQDLMKSVEVTPEEVTQYYATHGPDFDTLQVRQIAVATKPQNAKEGTPGLTLEEGRARAEAIKKALASGTDAKQVAKDLSIPNQVMVDPEARTIRQSASLPEFQKAAFKVKDREFTEIQQFGNTLVALQVLGHGHIELKDASQEVENALRKQKLDAEVAELKSKSNIWIDETYFKAPAGGVLGGIIGRLGTGAAAPAPQSKPPARP